MGTLGFLKEKKKGVKMKFLNNEETKIFALGCLGEVGKNMYCIMHNNEIVIIDAGMSIPAGDLLGVDYVIPDFSFLKKNDKLMVRVGRIELPTP